MRLVITESPRDAMQGLTDYIPVNYKADYINSLLKVGFDILDVGSFVSEKWMPQMKDTAALISQLDLSGSRSEIMVLVANVLGVEKAVSFDEIRWLCYPHSVSKTFLKKNIHSDEKQSYQLIDFANNYCEIKNKKFKVYLTMAFGNPYEDEYNIDMVEKSVRELFNIGIRFITLSDITGISNTDNIKQIFLHLIGEFPSVEFGFHLHTEKDSSAEKIDAAYINGCRSFDTVLNGMGGCPMTGFEMVNNLNTLDFLEYIKKKNIHTSIDFSALNASVSKNNEIFGIKKYNLFYN